MTGPAKGSATFVAENDRYEAWLRKQVDVDEDALTRKHKKMTKDTFSFLRATFFRWPSQITALGAELAKSPTVLGVGDCHVENFGTWRDGEGRLVWGVNDFDDAAVLPYISDLVRLATSARLAPRTGTPKGDASAPILKGYKQGLAAPQARTLDENEEALRSKVECSAANRADFWTEIDGLALPKKGPKPNIAAALKASLPADAKLERIVSRAKGGGSLGRPRFAAIASWRSGRIVREAKALVASGWNWAHGKPDAPIEFLAVANGTYRAPDPFLKIEEKFILRRVTADSRKASIEDDAGDLDTALFEAMGADLAAVHAASADAKALLADVVARPAKWLAKAADVASAAIEADYAEWVASQRKP